VRIAYNFYVYMMTNEWRNVLYTGVSNDLERRVWQHRNGVGSRFTRRYNCTRLVYLEWYADIRQAIAREAQIKAWSRAKKDALIANSNPEWRDLAESWVCGAAHPG
jgi:putative endonuclease